MGESAADSHEVTRRDGAPGGAAVSDATPVPEAPPVVPHVVSSAITVELKSAPPAPAAPVTPSSAFTSTTPSPAPSFRAAVGRFTITGELGRGGYGIVYRALDPHLERPVALKLLRDEVADGPARDRLVREARAVARLGKHPHVVQVHEAGELANGQVWIAMELAPGESLERVQARRRVGWEEAAAIVRKVALGLHHAHRMGLVHRDVKPSNVIVGPDGEPQITDFGVAKDLESGSDTITRSGAAVGTPAFMSPEQAQALPVDARSDVYGAGALLHALVRGEAPFKAPHVAMILTAVIQQDPPPLRGSGVDCPRDLETVVRKAMEKDPARRYASALLLAEDLGRVLRREPCLARRPSALESMVAHFVRHPRNFVLLLAIVGAGAVTYRYREAYEDRERLNAEAAILQERDRRALLSEELRVRLSAALTTGEKRRVCDQAIADMPVAWQPWHERGVIERDAAIEHAAKGDLDGALARYLAAERWLTIALSLAIDPAAPSPETAPRFWRGVVRLEGLDDLEGGRADLEKAADLSPGSGIAHRARYAASLAPAALPPAETASIEREIERGKALPVLRMQRAAALAARDPAAALEEAASTAGAFPVLARAHDLLAALHHAAGREDAAQVARLAATEVRAVLAAVRAEDARRAAQPVSAQAPASPR